MKTAIKIFTNKFQKIVDNIKSLGKKDPAAKQLVLSTFSTVSWNKLDENKRSKHSTNDCQGCLNDPVFKELLAKLPVKKNVCRKKAFLNDFNGRKSATLREVTNQLVTNLNQEFKSEYNTTFVSQIKTTTTLINDEKENTARAIKKDIKSKWKQNSLET